jgi:galactose mutarotase-like enzyme
MFLRRRRHDCRYGLVTVDGHRVVVLENSRLRVSVLPDRGADIVEFRHKPSDVDVLWRSPWPHRPASSPSPWSGSPDAAFLRGYLGGWQEMLPTCGDAATFEGLPLGVHGEVQELPWRWTVDVEDAEEVAVTFEVETVLAPFRVTRRMALSGDRATLVLDERIEHLGASKTEFMWGHHPAFGAPFLKEGCTIDTDARTILTTSHHADPAGRLAPDRRTSWPWAEGRDGAPLDLSVVPGPQAGTHDWAYLTDFERGWYALREPARGIGFALRWPAETWPYLLFWQNYRGATAAPWHGRAYVAALEPQSSFPASWDRGTPRLRLEPGEALGTRTVATAFRSDGRVSDVDDEGRVS